MKTLEDRELASLPVFIAKCTNCDKHYNGARPGRYYGTSYTERQWERGPVCENCKGSMTIVNNIHYG